MEFPIALLAFAAFLFVTGVVGRAAKVSGPAGFGMTLDGKVGGVPRVIFAASSGVLLTVALMTFLLALETTPPSTGSGSSGGTGAGSGETGSSEGTGSGETGSRSSGGESATKTPVDFTLLVGLRPQAGQVAEQMVLRFDGRRLTQWSADQSNPSQTIQLTAPQGRHKYTIEGTYAFWNASGGVEERAAEGAGSITIGDGTELGIRWLGGDNFRLEVLRSPQ